MPIFGAKNQSKLDHAFAKCRTSSDKGQSLSKAGRQGTVSKRPSINLTLFH
jgi:hypothetical protein